MKNYKLFFHEIYDLGNDMVDAIFGIYDGDYLVGQIPFLNVPFESLPENGCDCDENGGQL